MSCYLCNQPEEFVCMCDFLTLCSVHLPLHMNETSHKSIECLNIYFSNLDSHTFRKEVLNRITELNRSVKGIHEYSRKIINKLETRSEAAIKKIEYQIQFYSKLIRLSKLSESLLKEVDKIMSTTLKVKVIDKNIDAKVGDILDLEFFTLLNISDKEKKQKYFYEKKKREEAEYEEKIKAEVQEKMIKEAEKKKKEKEDEENKRKIAEERRLNDRAKGKYKIDDPNQWPLYERIQYLSSLLKLTFTDTKEIKFSTDKTYAFCCKIYTEDWREGLGHLLYIYNLRTKQRELCQIDTPNGIKETRGWLYKYPECYFKHTNFTR